ncbi:MAG: alpha/beta hydrolase [Bryobacterales bacterium]|nr:alpha/beta hydrolase [Bryobacterales bacterium]MDE0622553.1 alpha/beta hydrolase [Bryobacterales bacterium]
MLLRTLLTATVLCSIAVAQQQSNYPPNMPEARQETYKSVEGTDLKIWIFEPEGHKASDSRPAIVFFFGGGWRSGTPGQFRHQAKHLAARGMVAMSADYRVLNRQGVKGHKCVQDAKSAIRWARANAKRLGIDPNRLAAGGGSAGGHLAASTASLPDHDDPAGDKSISSKPNALALFNPGTVLASVPGKFELDKEQIASRAERAGVEPESISPYHHVKSGFPPAIIFHGKADTTVAYETAELFTDKVQSVGSRCELVGYEGEIHGFFNHGRGDGSAYTDTVRRMDEFFVSLGWLEPSVSDKPSQ